MKAFHVAYGCQRHEEEHGDNEAAILEDPDMIATWNPQIWLLRCRHVQSSVAQRPAPCAPEKHRHPNFRDPATSYNPALQQAPVSCKHNKVLVGTAVVIR